MVAEDAAGLVPAFRNRACHRRGSNRHARQESGLVLRGQGEKWCVRSVHAPHGPSLPLGLAGPRCCHSPGKRPGLLRGNMLMRVWMAGADGVQSLLQRMPNQRPEPCWNSSMPGEVMKGCITWTLLVARPTCSWNSWTSNTPFAADLLLPRSLARVSPSRPRVHPTARENGLRRRTQEVKALHLRAVSSGFLGCSGVLSCSLTSQPSPCVVHGRERKRCPGQGSEETR